MSHLFILLLYMFIGLLGYLKLGDEVRGSITLSLPQEPLYDAVRAMFTTSVLLSFPLTFYVPNEIIWNRVKKHLFERYNADFNFAQAFTVEAPQTILPIQFPLPSEATAERNAGERMTSAGDAAVNNLSSEQIATSGARDNLTNKPLALIAQIGCSGKGNQVISFENANSIKSELQTSSSSIPLAYEYYCRIIVVLLTFTLAYTVPKLNLLMDLIGSFSGTTLCLTIPALIHIAAIWDDAKGIRDVALLTVDVMVVIFSLVICLGGTLSSLISIAESFRH